MVEKFLKLTISFLALSLIFVPALNIVTYAEQARSNITMKASYIKNKPEKAGDLQVQDLDNGVIHFTKIDIDTTGVNALDGTINIHNNSIPFSLHGNFYTTGAEGRISAVLTDSLGNIDVKRFDIQQDPSKGIFLNRDLDENAFALYFSQKRANDLFFIEESVLQIIDAKTLGQIYSNLPTYQRAPDEAVMWVARLFQPDKSASDNDGIVPMSVSTKYTVHSYSDYYYIFGYYVTDKITIREEATFPTSTSEDIVGKIKVIGTSYSESNGIVLYDYTGWRIGGGPNGGALALKLTMNSPQVIQSQTLDGELLQSGSLSFNLSYSLSYYGVSAEVDYENDTTIDLNESTDILNGAKIAAAYKGSSSRSMALTGQYFASKWDIAYSSNQGTSQSATANIMFKFSVYNENSEKSLGVITEYSTSDPIQSI